MTLPATKYRFDDLAERGFIQDYVIDILPFAPDISQLSELRLDFRNENSLKDALSQDHSSSPVRPSLPLLFLLEHFPTIGPLFLVGLFTHLGFFETRSPT